LIYGAVGSIRESGSDSEYGKYFQQTDIERLHKVVDRHLFTVVRTFLQAKGVDTTELERNMRVVVRRAYSDPWRAGTRDSVRLVGNPAPGAGKNYPPRRQPPGPRNPGEPVGPLL